MGRALHLPSLTALRVSRLRQREENQAESGTLPELRTQCWVCRGNQEGHWRWDRSREKCRDLQVPSWLLVCTRVRLTQGRERTTWKKQQCLMLRHGWEYCLTTSKTGKPHDWWHVGCIQKGFPAGVGNDEPQTEPYLTNLNSKTPKNSNCFQVTSSSTCTEI